MDVSFMLPTCREVAGYIGQTEDVNGVCGSLRSMIDVVIQSIYDADPLGMSYEIIIVSPTEISGPHIRWIEDPDPMSGACHAYNLAYKCAKGDYVVGCADTLAQNKRVFELVNVLKHDFVGRRFKIITQQPHAASIGGMDLINIDPVPRYGRCGHIVMARETIENELNGYIFNPQFHHNATDQYMGLWVHIHGEPAVWHRDIHTIDLMPGDPCRPHCGKFERDDQETMRRLYAEIISGKRTQYAP